MFDFRLIQILVVLNIALFVRSASVGLPLETVYADSENVELVREKREADPRRGALLSYLANKHGGGGGGNYYRPTYQQEYHSSGGGQTATFAQSSAGAISANNGHGGHGGVGSQSSSQSASYSFGPFSASFSASQSNANGGGFFDY
ncbi:UNVERIFIED_CONTAM: hypothetical protein PYX00_010694 [Menopon gallinae]|uniref:Uncharacterized protein n=1 Tax=Menopon gallinae TaxID=328185 RepID=A0AAW2HGF2_9NEOP